MMDEKTHCGHSQPNRVQNIESPSHEWVFLNYEEVYIELEEDQKVSSSHYGDGWWTTIYDEGILLKFPDKHFYTYFMYADNGEGGYDSVCDKTLVGWYQPSDPKDHENWGCFFAYKDYVKDHGAKDISYTETWDATSEDTNVTKIEFLQSFLETKPIEMVELASKVNTKAKRWTAAVSDNFSGMSLAQVKSRMSKKRANKKQTNDHDAEFTAEEDVHSNLTPEQLNQLVSNHIEDHAAFLDVPLD